MEKLFVLNPILSLSDIKDAISDRISKISGIINCLMFVTEFVQGDDELDNNSIYHVLWAIDGFLGEINCLQQKLNEMISY